MGIGTFDKYALEAWEFARCQRSDGSIYGTSGQCRKGKEVGAKEASSPGPSRSTLDEYWQERAELSESRVDKKIASAFTGLQEGSEMYEGTKKRMAPYLRLSPDEKASVQMYGAAGVREQIFDEMNAKLRSGAEPSPEKKAAVEFTEAHLKSALDKLPDTEGQFFRAVCCVGVNSFTDLKPGQVIEDKGFGSYSDSSGRTISPFLNKDDKNIVMVVKGKTFKNVSPIMPYQEGEHLARPGTRLKLVEIRPEGFYHRKTGAIPAYVFEEV